MEARKALPHWATAVVSLLVGVTVASVGEVPMGELFLLVIGTATFFAAWGIVQFSWWHSPSVRMKREFKALAPDLAKASENFVGVLDSPIAAAAKADDRVTAAYARMLFLLARLDEQFGIRIPRDPYDLIHPREMKKVARLAAYAHAGHLEKARKIEWQPTFGPRD